MNQSARYWFLLTITSISLSYAWTMESAPDAVTWWGSGGSPLPSPWSRSADSYIGALGALSVAGAAAYGYYNYATYQAERLATLREFYTQLSGLLEYVLNPLNPDKQEVWLQWMSDSERAFNEGVAEIEQSLRVRRGFIWGHFPAVSRNARIIDNFRNAILYQKGLEQRAEEAGRPKPLPGETLKHAVKELTLLIASYLSVADERFVRELIAKGEREAAEARCLDTRVSASALQ